MRWKEDPLQARLGETRTLYNKFLWLPVTISGEVRWLEHASIKQMVCKVDIGGSGEWGKYRCKWRDICWVDY